MTQIVEETQQPAEGRPAKSPVTTPTLLRLAGLSALLAGICYVFVGVFHPSNVASSVTTTRWEFVHLIACAMCFFALLGLAGLYARQAKKVGWLGLIGYVLLSLWFVIIMGFTFVEAFILPRLATTDPKFVVAWMGMLVGPASHVYLGALPGVWTLTAPIYILGGVLFGITTFRVGILALGWRTAGPRDRIGPLGCSPAQRVPTEDRYSGGDCSCLDGLCTLVGATNSNHLTCLRR